MLSRLNNLSIKDRYFYGFILLLTIVRVWITRVRPCLPHFDCVSYLAMFNNMEWDPAIPGHHGMRILPIMLVRGVHLLGGDPTTAFRIVSGSLYCLLGVLLYGVLRKEKQTQWVALAFSLLCLAPHFAMRIPLQSVHQTCDMLTYLFTLAILYCSFKRQANSVFLLSILAVLTRQNLFILGELSLLYCIIVKADDFSARRQTNEAPEVHTLVRQKFICEDYKPLLYAGLLALEYFSLQRYFHASGVFRELLEPPAGYFTFSHLSHILLESKLHELFIPLIPFLILSFKELVRFFVKYWHAALYVAIVVGQPLLGYHLTGNNFQRLALQGVWVIFLACAFTWPREASKRSQFGLLAYSLAMYFTWPMDKRLIIVLIYLLFIRQTLFHNLNIPYRV